MVSCRVGGSWAGGGSSELGGRSRADPGLGGDHGWLRGAEFRGGPCWRPWPRITGTRNSSNRRQGKRQFFTEERFVRGEGEGVVESSRTFDPLLRISLPPPGIFLPAFRLDRPFSYNRSDRASGLVDLSLILYWPKHSQSPNTVLYELLNSRSKYLLSFLSLSLGKSRVYDSTLICFSAVSIPYLSPVYF